MSIHHHLPPHCRLVVAIPACNEEGRLGACLAALAVQRDAVGAPLPADSFAVLVLANNCTDGTAAEARRWAAFCAMPVLVVEQRFSPAQSNAGWARKEAMDQAERLLSAAGHRDGVICTTDADSVVCSTWIAGTVAALATGVDAVAGYIEAQPGELITLGPAFVARGRLEDTYLAATAEIWALCDPLPHDPWPNHRVASGASFAVTVAAYQAIGGLPPRALGEDVALAATLVAHGFRIRHPLDLVVRTSCRLDGRAAGGAADTMKLRRDHPDSPCDDDMEPARHLVRRAGWKARLRGVFEKRGRATASWATRLGLGADRLAALAAQHEQFEPFWLAVADTSPALQRANPLRPSDLPVEIERARSAIRHLRCAGAGRALPRGTREPSLAPPSAILIAGPLAEGTVRR